MAFKRSADGNLIEIDSKVRVESGPVRKKDKATSELLSNDVTADHYQVGRLDSMSKKIEIGKPMDYIDWKSDTKAWYVYELAGTKKIKMIEGPRTGETIEKPDWQLRGTHETEDAAISQAMTMVPAQAKS